jgi:phytoene dehydrogenase-like protein
MNTDIIIVGAGLAGLTCARVLAEADIPFVILEADQQIGGRLKTDEVDGFLLDQGFQVLQTAYPEAQRVLDFERLKLKAFAPGAIIRIDEEFHKIADPRRRPSDLWSTATAPIGTIKDRLRMINLALKVRRKTVSDLFQAPDMTTIDFLEAEGFSQQIIQKFFIPFFSGVCLDPQIQISSRVFRYIFRIFAEGDVALPAKGMGVIPEQLAENLPESSLRTSAKAKSIQQGRVELESGEIIEGRLIILATEEPETARLIGVSNKGFSRGELCLYFSAEKPPINESYLILNGNKKGWVNSLTIPSLVAPTYAPAGKHLISVVVVGHMDADDATVEPIVRKELNRWFGPEVNDWRHLKTYRISHALPAQSPPMPDPTAPAPPVAPGIYVCGEYASVPGIQWAMHSGRHAAEQIIVELNKKSSR